MYEFDQANVTGKACWDLIQHKMRKVIKMSKISLSLRTGFKVNITFSFKREYHLHSISTVVFCYENPFHSVNLTSSSPGKPQGSSRDPLQTAEPEIWPLFHSLWAWGPELRPHAPWDASFTGSLKQSRKPDSCSPDTYSAHPSGERVEDAQHRSHEAPK